MNGCPAVAADGRIEPPHLLGRRQTEGPGIQPASYRQRDILSREQERKA